MQEFVFSDKLGLTDLNQFVFRRELFGKVRVSSERQKKILTSHGQLMSLIEKGVPIYGVTTGFGDSCHRYVQSDLSEKLQVNLIEYLSCGLGPTIPLQASRAMFFIRLNSLSQGYSGVSLELIEHMCRMLENDIIPVVPREGSLGASGDLVPLAYLGQAVQGKGEVHFRGQIQDCAEVFQKTGLTAYRLKAKEGLAIVNGTSTMAGMFLYNLKQAEQLVGLVENATAWLCLALGGKREAFGRFINEVAKTNVGQAQSANLVSQFLDEENYFPQRGQDVAVDAHKTIGFVQDRYSLRCVPQILGPIRENLMHCREIIEHESNSITDNPVLNFEGQLEMGGNFYGGYLSQGMDYLKINLAQMADLMDRQITMLVDEKSNRGLPPNLAAIEHLPEEERHLHHSLKGVHQAMSALTSEMMQKSIPSSIFSRSSESHNQDKVSLGMSAAVTCQEMLEGLYKLAAMQLICLAQALDLRKIELQGKRSQALYQTVRSLVPFVQRDVRLGEKITALKETLQRSAFEL
jgi:histidine ammonia-lyase